MRISSLGMFASRTRRQEVSNQAAKDETETAAEQQHRVDGSGSTSPGRIYAATKRGFDLALVLAAAPVWLPLYVLIAMLILLFDGLPIHHRDPRVGRHGREIFVLKFRSMHVDADEQLADLLAEQPALKDEFSRFQKLRSDPRVTRIGRALRRFSLDELPQLFHVLRGDMSIVGPRPLTRAEVDRFYADQADVLLSVPPGLTGLWQISGRSWLTLDERVRLDLKYVRERRLRLDLEIFLKTIPSVVRGHGVA